MFCVGLLLYDILLCRHGSNDKVAVPGFFLLGTFRPSPPGGRRILAIVVAAIPNGGSLFFGAV